jgi:hypothetical protein
MSKNIESSGGGTCKYFTTGDTSEFESQLSSLVYMKGKASKIEL